jgi:hypothetical protein
MCFVNLYLDALFRRQSSPGCSTADGTPMAPSLDSRTSSVPSLASFSIDRLHLDPGLDFVVHADGTIELTAPGSAAWGKRTPRDWTP